MLDRAVRLWEENSSLLQEAGGLSFVHYDFQPQNLRVEPVSGRIVSVLDLDNSTRGPAFSDIRDLLLTVFVPDPGSAEPFWRAYGPVDEHRRVVLRLHSLPRVLDVLWAYAGPAPEGWNHTTVATLLKDIETAWRDSITVAVADPDRQEPRLYGTIASTDEAVAHLADQLADPARPRRLPAAAVG